MHKNDVSVDFYRRNCMEHKLNQIDMLCQLKSVSPTGVGMKLNPQPVLLIVLVYYELFSTLGGNGPIYSSGRFWKWLSEILLMHFTLVSKCAIFLEYEWYVSTKLGEVYRSKLRGIRPKRDWIVSKIFEWRSYYHNGENQWTWQKKTRTTTWKLI